MTRLTRLTRFALLLLGLMLPAAGPAEARDVGTTDMRAVGSAAQLAWKQPPTADPDGGKASLGAGGGEDTATGRTVVRIDWPYWTQRSRTAGLRALALATHPACASPPRAPPHA